MADSSRVVGYGIFLEDLDDFIPNTLRMVVAPVFGGPCLRHSKRCSRSLLFHVCHCEHTKYAPSCTYIGSIEPANIPRQSRQSLASCPRVLSKNERKER